ncbi:MAG: hypothetical protein II169_03540 [Lachnospiraceae bacterium]|nr:hypothetical protein [Lachnospiraceae bacterium]
MTKEIGNDKKKTIIILLVALVIECVVLFVILPGHEGDKAGWFVFCRALSIIAPFISGTCITRLYKYNEKKK